MTEGLQYWRTVEIEVRNVLEENEETKRKDGGLEGRVREGSEREEKKKLEEEEVHKQERRRWMRMRK
jgi:hypothetical protein